MLNIVCCGIFKKEVKVILEELGYSSSDLTFLDPGLHVNFNRLKRGLEKEVKSQKTDRPTMVIIGQACHPDMIQNLKDLGVIGINASNCFEALLGAEKAILDKEANTYYITSGWFENWQQIFKKDMGWTEVDARLNLGFYDRLLLLDTGLCEITDEGLLEFYDFVQIPVEVKKVSLAHLEQLIKEALDDAEKM